jgi:hypothetical protein
VLGEFPKLSLRGVVPLLWIEKCIDENKQAAAILAAETDRIPKVAGLDVARYGDNVCVLIVRQGDAIVAIESWSHATLMETTGKAMDAIRRHNLSALVVDSAGIGAGVCDRLREQNAPVYDYNGGHRSTNPSTFTNRRTELWWTLRTRFEKGRIWLVKSLETDRLVRELIIPEYEINSSGRIKMDTKESLLRAGKKSPDFADALTMAFALDSDPLDLGPSVPAFSQDPNPIFMTQEQEESPFPQLPSGF